jgi:hypothetical protein
LPTTASAPSGKSPEKNKNVVQLNTGLVIATDASYASEAIKKNPTGPLVQ